MSDPLQDSDRTALQELLESRGWQLFCQFVLTEIADEFENDITKALSHEDGTIAVDRMRQVAAVRKAGLRWLELPKRKLGMLERQQEADAQMARPGRRPAGL